MRMKRTIVITATLICVTLYIPISVFGQSDVFVATVGNERITVNQLRTEVERMEI